MSEPTCPHCGMPTRPLTYGEKVAVKAITVSGGVGEVMISGPSAGTWVRSTTHCTSTAEALCKILRQNYASAIDAALKDHGVRS